MADASANEGGEGGEGGGLQNICVLGAGSIGCWVGGELALHGTRVSFVTRASRTGNAMLKAVRAHGLTLEVAGGGKTRSIPPTACREAFTTDAAASLRVATAVLVVTKRHANPSIAALLAACLAPSTPIVLLQNGLGAVDEMRALIAKERGRQEAERPIHQAVVRISATLVHAEGRVVRSGPIVQLDLDGLLGLAQLLRNAGIPTNVFSSEVHQSLLRGKLMMNMLNAPNALSGKSLSRMFVDRRAVALAAGTMRELESAYRVLGWRSEPRLMRALPLVMAFLALYPINALLRAACAVIAALTGAHPLGDATSTSKSSTMEDLDCGRPTEMAFLNGEVVKLCLRAGVAAPINDRVLCEMALIESAAIARVAAAADGAAAESS